MKYFQLNLFATLLHLIAVGLQLQCKSVLILCRSRSKSLAVEEVGGSSTVLSEVREQLVRHTTGCAI